MRSNEEILALAAERKAAGGGRQAKMREIAEVYNGEVVLPLPELDANEVAAVANVLQSGLDGTAQRAASTMPDVDFPSQRPGFDRHDQAARDRRKACLGWWQRNSMDLMLARRFRHFMGYATSPVVLRPSSGKNGVPPGIPEWHVRDPLSAYPAPSARLDTVVPSDALFCIARTTAWVRSAYPGALSFLRPPTPGRRPEPSDTKVELIEYYDDEVVVLLATGESATGVDPTADDDRYGPPLFWGSNGYSTKWARQLERFDNRAGRPLAAFPGRITLSGPIGQFDSLPGMHYKRAKLDALEYIAIEEGVFPRLWLVSNPNETAVVEATPNPRQGFPGRVSGGNLVNLNTAPSYMANMAMDRLERNERVDGHVPSQMGGENPTNVRTGRASDAVLGASIDYGIAEAQKVMAASLAAENEIAVDVMRGHFARRPQSWAVSWKGAKGRADYTAEELFPPGAEHNVVSYPMAGADLNGQVIRVGQLLGTGLASKEWGRERTPEIEDPEVEADRIVAEQLEDSVLAELLQPGSMSVVDKARVAELVVQGKMTTFAAIAKVQAEAQERQASSGPVGAPDGPVLPGSPEAQPGIVPPGMGAEAPAVIPEPGPSQANLGMLLNQLRTVRTSAAADQPAGRVA